MTTLVAPKPSCGNFWSRARRFFACRPWRMSKRSLVMVGLRGLATSWIIWPSYIIFGIPGDLLSEINDFRRMIRWCSPQVKRLDCRATGEPWGYPGHFRRWLCTSTTAWSHGAAPRKLATTGCITDVWEQCIGLMVCCSNQYLMENSLQIEIPRVSHDVPIYLLQMVLYFGVAQWCPYLKLVNNPHYHIDIFMISW